MNLILMMNKFLKQIVLTGLLVINGTVLADQTYLLQLSKDMAKEMKQFDSVVKEIKNVKRSNGGKKYHQQALSLPNNSIDRQYATSKYINEELKLRVKEYEVLTNLGHSSDKLADVVKKYLKELKDSQKNKKGFNIKSQRKAVANKMLNQVRGINSVLDVVINDPSVNKPYNRGEVVTLSRTKNNLINLIKLQANSKRNHSYQHIVQEMHKTLKIQRPLIMSSLMLLETKIKRLEGMQLSDDTRQLTNNIHHSVGQISQIIGGKESEARDKRDDDIEALVQPEWEDELQYQHESHDEFFSRMSKSINGG